MDGFVTVRIPAGAVVRLSAQELLAIEYAARHDRPLDDDIPAPDETSEVSGRVVIEMPEAAPRRGAPAPTRLSAAEKEALKDWAATRGERPKYVTKQRIRDYVAATGDTTLEHLLEEAAPRRDADRTARCATGAPDEVGGAA